MGAKDDIGRIVQIRRALRLERLTAIWMAIEAAVAIISGVAAHSVSLVAFGADSLIELATAWVLIWRLKVELLHGDKFSEAVEHRASRMAGILLFALALYVVVTALYGLSQRQGQEFSIAGLTLTALAIPIMWFLARAKLRIAERIGSRALRADAVESITCGYLSAIVFVGLIVQLFVPGWWWVDGVASLAIVAFLVKEGREAWRADDDSD